MLRLFTAIKIHPGKFLLNAFEEFRSELSKEKINWVKPENIHITLKFFGQTPSRELPVIKSALNEAALGVSSFNITVKGCGTFGSSRFPRVIWLGLESNDCLKTLYESINSKLSKEGYLPEERGFSPHLTIGRVKHIKGLYTLDSLISRYNDSTFTTQKIEDFQLFESILQKEGPVYKIIERFKLKT